MPNGQNDNLFAIKVVKRNVCALPKLHQPFAELRKQIFYGPTDLRMPAQFLDAIPNRLNRVLRSLAALRCEESMEASYVLKSMLRPD